MTEANEFRVATAPRHRSAWATHVLVIVNPASRRGRAALSSTLLALRETDLVPEVAETFAPRHATTLVHDAVSASPGKYAAVLSLGGDGTAMEVASALAEIADAPPLGIVAVGTANILARSLGIPVNPSRAVAALLNAEAVPIDIGRVERGPAFAIGLGIGLDAAMIGGVSTRLKRRIGYAAYALSALRAGLRLERFRATITVDGEVHVVDASSVLVANFGTVLGGLLCFGEEIGHRDGVLDVCVYSPGTYFEAVRIFWRMLRGGVSNDCRVRIIRGRHVRIETDPPRPMQADGDLLGLTPVDIRVEPSAVRVLVPHATPRRWRLPRLAVTRAHTDQPEKCTP